MDILIDKRVWVRYQNKLFPNPTSIREILSLAPWDCSNIEQHKNIQSLPSNNP